MVCGVWCVVCGVWCHSHGVCVGLYEVPTGIAMCEREVDSLGLGERHGLGLGVGGCGVVEEVSEGDAV